MSASILLHVLGVARGLASALACAAGFYLAGFVLIPRRWDRSLGLGESPAMLGAALYVLVCWFGIAAGIPLTRLAGGFAGTVVLATIVRYRWMGAALNARGVLSRSTLGWVLAFALLYILAYVFTMPPVSAEYLAPAWTGNIDLLTYVNYTKYLYRLGTWNLPAFYNPDVYLQTPAVFYLFGWLSFLFDRDPVSAAMAAQFAFTALIGVSVARLSRTVFGASPVAALAIAAILISGPFFRYIVGAYYLSTMMAVPVLLYLVQTTVADRSPRLIDPALMIRLEATFILLLFLYPFLFFAGLAAQAALVFLMWIAEMQSGDNAAMTPREAGLRMGRAVSAILIPLGLLTVGFYGRLRWSLEMVLSLSKKGVAGWPLDMISPLALFGLPGTRTDRGQCSGCLGIEIAGPGSRGWAAAIFCAAAVILGCLYFWRAHRQTTTAQRACVGLAAGSFIAYCAYFFLLGPSYQQWKFASYTALPLSAVAFASVLHLWRQPSFAARLAQTARGARLSRVLPGVVAVGLVGGNLVVHAMGDPDLLKFPGELRNLSQVNELRSFRELTVQMTDDPTDHASWLAIYYLPSKRVHVISARFRPNEALSFNRISRERPLLIQNYGCEGVGHGDAVMVPDLGCLLFAPPSLSFDTMYPFSHSFLFVGFDGLGAREPEGRRNEGPTVRVTLSADLRRTWVQQDAYVNLLINPYLPPGTPRQRLRFSWGTGQHAEASLDARGWLSLPIRGADWTGSGVQTLKLSIDLPDAVDPPLMYTPRGRLGEGGPLAAVFEELSIGLEPRGPAVAPPARTPL